MTTPYPRVEEFLLKESEPLRKAYDNSAKEIGELERYTLLATGAIWSLHSRSHMLREVELSSSTPGTTCVRSTTEKRSGRKTLRGLRSIPVYGQRTCELVLPDR